MHKAIACFFLAVTLSPLLPPSAVQAHPADPPQRCKPCCSCPKPPCTGPCTWRPGAERKDPISLTQGNLAEQYNVVTINSAFGPTIDMAFSYKSYNADGSRTNLDTVMGFGWTHSYNILLFREGGAEIFRMDGDGWMTAFEPGPDGTFIPSTGYFETLVQNPDDTFTLKQKDGTVFDFALIPGTPFDFLGNPVYRATRIVDRNNNVTTLSFTNGNLTSITDTYGRSLVLSYNGNNKLIAMTDPLGRTTTLAYDLSGTQLLAITDPDGKSIQYEYTVWSQMTRRVDRDGRSFSYAYDDHDKPVGILDAAGESLFTLSNPLHWATEEGVVRSYVPTTTSLTDGRGNVWRYDYERHGYISAMVAPDGDTTRYTYDPATLMLSSMTDANNHITAYEYDLLGNLVAQTDAVGDVTRYTYETVFSNIIRKTDARGLVTTYDYDDRGNRIRETDPLSNRREWTYDAHGNVLTERDKNGNVRTYEYDGFGNRVTEINGAGDVTRFSYDGVGKVISITEPNGNVVTNSYDALDRVTRVEDLMGVVVIYAYDGEGNRLGQRDGNGNSVAFVYDLRQRQTGIIDALGQITTQTYDGNNNRISITDRNGHRTTFEYDVQNRLSRLTDARGGITQYQPDGVGNLVRITDANGHSTVYQYDAANRLTREFYADGGARSFTYDALGMLLTRTDQTGQTTNYRRDELYRITERSYPVSPHDNFTYDAEGRTLTVERGGWLVTFTYDGANRIIQTRQNGQIVNYIYDIPRRTRAVTYPSGRVSVEQRDFRSRLKTIDDGVLPTPIVEYNYDAGNRVINRIYRNGTVANYSYNANNWVMELEHSLGANRIAGFAHDYDREGNKKFEEKRHDPARSEAYQYDDIYRVIDFKVGQLVGPTIPAPVTQTQYGLDPVGNWNGRTKDGVTENRTHNASNQITSIDAVPIFHDNKGNLIEDERFRYAYDEENRVIRATRKTDGRVMGEYQYDALGRRVVKRANAGETVTRYFYDGNRIIEEQNDSGLTLATYVYGNDVDEVLTMDRGGQTVFYHQNTVRSVAAITDRDANVLERYAYDAYGCATPTSAIGNPYLFTGRQLDDETGLYYYRARYYDCVKGRFVQRDPLGYEHRINWRVISPDGMNLARRLLDPLAYSPLMNLYEYVLGNPMKRVDPTGIQPIPPTPTGPLAGTPQGEGPGFYPDDFVGPLPEGAVRHPPWNPTDEEIGKMCDNEFTRYLRYVFWKMGLKLRFGAIKVDIIKGDLRSDMKVTAPNGGTGVSG